AQAIANRMRDDALLFFDVLPRLRELPDVRQLADRHLATSRAKTAREVAKDFLTLVTDRDRLRGGIKIAAWPAGS
ncbi:MAG TPA: hypothetical protein VM574_03575, partial [Terrimicrobiaceae bacterium]|nr:hypothetical protein [Terrimicrobiaceae bacterium]